AAVEEGIRGEFGGCAVVAKHLEEVGGSLGLLGEGLGASPAKPASGNARPEPVGIPLGETGDGEPVGNAAGPLDALEVPMPPGGLEDVRVVRGGHQEAVVIREARILEPAPATLAVFLEEL